MNQDRSSWIINYFSLGALAVSGIMINTLIASVYGADVLGVFSQGFVIYLLAAQCGVLGIHYSVLRSVSQNLNTPKELVKIVTSGFFATTSVAVTVGIGLFLSREYIGSWLNSEAVSKSLIYVAPATAIFSLNKYLAAVLNGQGRMKIFALNRGLRYVLAFCVLAIAAQAHWPGFELTLALLFSEGLLLLINLFFVAPLFQVAGLSPQWIKHHYSFGLRGYFSGLFMVLQSRLDLLVLGYFLNDRLVGIYSLAAVFAEGFYQLLEVICDFTNPHLARLLQKNDRESINKLFFSTSRFLLPASFLAAIVLLGFFYIYLQFIDFSQPMESLKILAILLIGTIVVSVFVPFYGLLVQAGYPAQQSLTMFIGTIVNVGLNLILIPRYGLPGAAYATVVSFVAIAATMNILMKRSLGFSFFGSIMQRVGL